MVERLCKRCGVKPGSKYSKYASGDFCSRGCACSYATFLKRAEINKVVSAKLIGHPAGPGCFNSVTARMAGQKGGPKGGRSVWRLHRKKMMQNLSHGKAKSDLAYRRDEKSIKRLLENRYDTVFCKERIGNVVFDFANKEYLIEHSKDGTHGLSDALRRFESLTIDDGRKRIAFVKIQELGPSRMARFVAAGVKVIDYRKLTGSDV